MRNNRGEEEDWYNRKEYRSVPEFSPPSKMWIVSGNGGKNVLKHQNEYRYPLCICQERGAKNHIKTVDFVNGLKGIE
jgi:hypothetical protein